MEEKLKETKDKLKSMYRCINEVSNEIKEENFGSWLIELHITSI